MNYAATVSQNYPSSEAPQSQTVSMVTGSRVSLIPVHRYTQVNNVIFIDRLYIVCHAGIQC